MNILYFSFFLFNNSFMITYQKKNINLLQSELVPIGNMPNMEELVEILGCQQSSLPLKYLGLLLGASHKEETIWNPVLEKMERRLAEWKRFFYLRGAK